MPEGLAPEASREAHPVILCEGVEDGVSLAGPVPEARVWACTSLGHMGAAPIHLDCVSRAIVAIDNDWSNPQALAQLEDVLAQLEASGKPIGTMRSAIGKDFNDGFTTKE